ncbi:hypothetical protein TSAR_000210 [Trichomalopsis sarcophagae]|uniref:Uncharacterized protein n=1 Tax=Trichomalopsis sarcophagae TaxID=543379 RepID=A0A232FD71_9HYME|nr:hypothetical protein TSAR_000210 [Trichomalopsis sarcophagae]
MAPAVCSVSNDDFTSPTKSRDASDTTARDILFCRGDACNQVGQAECQNNTGEALPPPGKHQRFDILQDQLDGLRAVVSRSLVPHARASQDLDTGSLPVSDCGPLLASSPSIIEREATEVAGKRKCSSPQMAPTGKDAGSWGGVAEGFEVIIHGLIQNIDNINKKISGTAAFALLSTVLPTLQKSDVASVLR